MAGPQGCSWGCIPVEVRLRSSVWRTSLFPKDGRYLMPIKAVVRRAERLAQGDLVEVDLLVGP